MGYNNEQYGRQLILFNGMSYGKLMPTDIDAMIEYKDKAFIFIEVKHINFKELPTGQRIALERLVLAGLGNNKRAVAIVATHNTEADIILKDCPVDRIFFGHHWVYPSSNITVGQLVDKLVKDIEEKGR
jgi:hypothetical protein